MPLIIFLSLAANHVAPRPTAWVKPFPRRGSSTSSTDPSSSTHAATDRKRNLSGFRDSDLRLSIRKTSSEVQSENDSVTSPTEIKKLKAFFHNDSPLSDLKSFQESGSSSMKDGIKTDRHKSAFKKVRKRAKTPPSADSMDANVNKMDLYTNNGDENNMNLNKISSSLKRSVTSVSYQTDISQYSLRKFS